MVASGRVGFLDWVQIKADDVASLTDWLDANGYPYSTAASTVFSYYVQKGWYFIAFRISQDAVPGGGTVCRALGPVSLSFPTPKPVIPSRMATAGNTSGPGRYAWRIFGITSGDRQLAPASAFAESTLWYSGAIDAASAPSFAGLAEPGDRLTRLTFTFYGSSTEDVALATAAPADYRGTETIVVYDESCSISQDVRRPRDGRGLLAGLAVLAVLGWRRRR